MKTNKLPESEWSDSWAAGSQSQQPVQTNRYDSGHHMQQTKNASNDANYRHKKLSHGTLNNEQSSSLSESVSSQDSYFGYKSADKRSAKVKEFAMDNVRSNGL